MQQDLNFMLTVYCFPFKNTIPLDYCHCYGLRFVLEGKENNNFILMALPVACSSENNFDKEAGNRIEFRAVSQMEENMNNKRSKYT